MLEFAVSELPSIYSSIISWLQPPYLYILINAIIISILASSKLQHKSQPSPLLAKTVPYHVQPPVPVNLDYETYTDVVISSTPNVNDTAANKVHGNEANVHSSSSKWTSPYREESLEFSLLNDNSYEMSRPPAYSRLSRHKSIKANLQAETKLLGSETEDLAAASCSLSSSHENHSAPSASLLCLEERRKKELRMPPRMSGRKFVETDKFACLFVSIFV